jgi:FkbM family methyltransferase
VSFWERIAADARITRAVDAVRDLPIPLPVRLPDGALRPGSVRLWLLAGFWRRVPSQRQETAAVYAAYDGGDVIDVGAFHGWYSAMLAPKALPGDRFVSLEPNPKAFSGLQRNLATLGEMFDGVGFWALPEAVGDGRPVTAIDPSEHHPSYRPAADGESSGPASITVDRVVELAGLRPSLVKVDVEGAEWFVVSGMMQTLRRHAPTVVLELHTGWQPPGVAADDVLGLLRDAAYSLETIGGNGREIRQLLCRPPATTVPDRAVAARPADR